jgi:hypothetical protein
MCKGLETGGLCHDKKSELEFLADQSGIDKEINHPTAATDSSQNQWQIPKKSILIPMDCVNLPRLKFQISKVRCTHKQPPRQIRLHTCTWQALKQHICTWQAHKVLPNWRIVMYGFFSSGKSPITSSQVKLCFLIGSVCPMSQITQDKLHLPVGSMCQMSQQIKCIHSG